MGLRDLGLKNVGHGDAGTRELWDAGTQKRWDLGMWDIGTQGRDKQTPPDFFR